MPDLDITLNQKVILLLAYSPHFASFIEFTSKSKYKILIRSCTIKKKRMIF